VGRRLGQHFLFDPSILERIVDTLDPQPDDVVLEIGAGKGTLTRRLAARVGRVIAVERDPRLAAVLRGEGGRGKGEASDQLPGNVTVVEGNALELDWHRAAGGTVEASPDGGGTAEVTLPASRFLLPEAGGEERWKVAGNIPYSITTPLIDKALRPPPPGVVVFLVQREVADRLAAGPGGKIYGALSVGVQAVAHVERLFDVPAGAFRPPPKVDSAVVRLVPLDEPLVAEADQAAFRRFVTALFGRRRKQLVGALCAVTESERDRVQACLAGAGVDPKARGETLPVATIVRLFRELGR
jgi:16S rRNA (adenine1518-N6/adenine1519-N6)-dimethyltransferase